jgi:hypothetical protein
MRRIMVALLMFCFMAGGVIAVAEAAASPTADEKGDKDGKKGKKGKGKGDKGKKGKGKGDKGKKGPVKDAADEVEADVND